MADEFGRGGPGAATDWSDSRVHRQRLIELLRAAGALTDESVARAFRSVPREAFLPGIPLDDVYQDQAIVTKEEGGVPVSSSSQPAIMALMLQQLDVRPGMQVLEIGAGTGYNAALLRELVGERGRVVTVEIDPEVAVWAEERLRAAGYPEVAVVRADGAEGYPSLAPYDRIQLTVGSADIAPAWVEQLAEGGILVLPLWVNSAQVSVALQRRGGALHSLGMQPCGFMRIRGRLASGDQFVRLDPHVMVAPGNPDLPLDRLRALLRLGAGQPLAVAYSPGWSFVLWLALRDALRDAQRGGQVLGVFTQENALGFDGAGFGLYTPPPHEGVALLILPPNDFDPAEVLCFGDPAGCRRLLDELEAWHAAGEPTTSDFRLEVWPKGNATAPAAGSVTVETVHQELVFSLPGAQLALPGRSWNNP